MDIESIPRVFIGIKNKAKRAKEEKRLNKFNLPCIKFRSQLTSDFIEIIIVKNKAKSAKEEKRLSQN